VQMAAWARGPRAKNMLYEPLRNVLVSCRGS
jgi:hypothetical protein